MAAADGPIGVSAQDVFWEEEGAYTGEVAPGMLSHLGVTRGYHRALGEAAPLRRDGLIGGEEGPGCARPRLLAILCVGETEAERESGETESVLSRQVPAGLAGVAAAEAGRVAVAYEPIWAIGTGKTATPGIAQEAVAFVRAEVGEDAGSRRG